MNHSDIRQPIPLQFRKQNPWCEDQQGTHASQTTLFYMPLKTDFRIQMNL